MAALSGITAVRPTENTRTQQGLYGETIGIGQSVYLDSTDNKWKLADANSTEAKAEVVGVSVTPGVSGSYGIIAHIGSIILVGTTMAPGKSYHVGQTPGSLVPQSDLVTGDWSSRVGSSKTTEELVLSIEVLGVQLT